MFGLFELAKLISFIRDDQKHPEKVQIVRHAWKEVGEKSFLSIFFTNGEFPCDQNAQPQKKEDLCCSVG